MHKRVYPILSVLLFGFLYCYTAIGVIIVLILAVLKIKKPFYVISQYWAKSIFFFMGKKLNINGIENIRKGEKYILVANHSSLFDIVAITSFYPGISWFGHERLLKVPLFSIILRMTDYVPFKEPNYLNTKKMMEQLVQKSTSQTVAIFPEGTRTLDGKINGFYRGFIYLFRARNIDILPVTLNGFFDLKPKNRMSINFDAKMEVIIHEPVKKEILYQKSDREIIDTVKGIITSAYRENKQVS